MDILYSSMRLPFLGAYNLVSFDFLRYKIFSKLINLIPIEDLVLFYSHFWGIKIKGQWMLLSLFITRFSFYKYYLRDCYVSLH